MIERFKTAMQTAGIEPPADVIADGKLHRFHSGGKTKNKNGWYVFYADDPASGAFGDWKTGVNEKWCSKSGQTMTPEEKAAYAEKMETARRLRDAERERAQAECRTWCADKWQTAQPASDDHLYLKNKGIGAHGLKTFNDNLIVPVQDITGTIHGLQFIAPDGSKVFKTGTAKAGHFFQIGESKDNTIIICEGYATGATIHEVTGHAVCVAFDAGNLLSVAQIHRLIFPTMKIIIAADDDHGTEGNPGLAKASEAARAVNGTLAIPVFPDDRGPKDTDFNDLARISGPEAVKQCFDQNRSCASISNFHFISADELCREGKAANWLVKPLLDCDTLTTIFGASGSGKSFIATDIGLCIAANKPWHDFPVKKPGTVFYIAGEGRNGLNRRVKAWADHHGCDLKEIPFYVSNRPAQILEPNSVQEIQSAIDELVEKHGNPVLVIIDTLNRNFGPGDENSTADMTRFISGLDEIRARYQCAILVVHHSGLAATDRARGASALRAALDWEYRVSKNADGSRTLTCTKSKDYAEPEPISFVLDIVSLDWLDDDGAPETSCVVRLVDAAEINTAISLKGTQRIAYDALIKLGGEGIDVDAWRMSCYDAGISATSNTEAKRKAFKRAVSGLQDRGLVSAKNDFWWAKNIETGQMNYFNNLHDDEF